MTTIPREPVDSTARLHLVEYVRVLLEIEASLKIVPLPALPQIESEVRQSKSHDVSTIPANTPARGAAELRPSRRQELGSLPAKSEDLVPQVLFPSIEKLT